MIIINGIEKRNLPEQVKKNKEDIEGLDGRVEYLEAAVGTTEVLTDAKQEDNKLIISKYEAGVESTIEYEPHIDLSNCATVEDLQNETEARTEADNSLQSGIDDIIANYDPSATVDDKILVEKSRALGIETSLSTDVTTIQGNITDINSRIAALSGQLKIKVVVTQPETPENGTMYYIGTASPYVVKLYNDNTWYEMGTTEVDLSNYTTKQQAYDLCFPIGDVKFGVQAPTVPAGITATWTFIGDQMQQYAYMTFASTEAEAGSVEAESCDCTETALTVAQMPKHSHTRGTMNITGYFGCQGNDSYPSSCSGAFFTQAFGTVDSGTSGRSDYNNYVGFNAARNWTGNTSEVGSGAGHNHTIHHIRPQQIKIGLWMRTA